MLNNKQWEEELYDTLEKMINYMGDGGMDISFGGFNYDAAKELAVRDISKILISERQKLIEEIEGKLDSTYDSNGGVHYADGHNDALVEVKAILESFKPMQK